MWQSENNQLESFKDKLKHSALSSFQRFKKHEPQPIFSKEEMEALLGTLIVETVELHRRGAPDAALEEESLPVDLLLCNPNKYDPFLLGEEIKNSLMKLLNLIKF